MKKDFCVIGLGKFGKAVVEKLLEENNEIMAIDKDIEVINEIAPHVHNSIQLNAIHVEALEKAGVKKFSTVIIAVGSDIEASLLVAKILKEWEIKNIFAKAINSRHAEILAALGVPEANIVLSDIDAGKKIAMKAMHQLKFDFSALSENHSMIGVMVTSPKYAGKTLEEIDLRKKGKSIIALIKRDDKTFIPSKNTVVNMSDEIIFVVHNDDINKVKNLFSK